MWWPSVASPITYAISTKRMTSLYMYKTCIKHLMFMLHVWCLCGQMWTQQNNTFLCSSGRKPYINVIRSIQYNKSDSLNTQKKSYKFIFQKMLCTLDLIGAPTFQEVTGVPMKVTGIKQIIWQAQYQVSVIKQKPPDLQKDLWYHRICISQKMHLTGDARQRYTYKAQKSH